MSASTNGKMKRRFRWQAVCVVLAIGLQGCYSPGQFRHAQPIADRFIHLLSSGQYTQAVSMIDPKKQNSYRSSYLAQRWTQLEHAVGKPYVTSLSGMYIAYRIDLSGDAEKDTGRGLRFAYQITGTKGSYEVNVWLRQDGKRWTVWQVSIPAPASPPRRKTGASPARSE